MKKIIESKVLRVIVAVSICYNEWRIIIHSNQQISQTNFIYFHRTRSFLNKHLYTDPVEHHSSRKWTFWYSNRSYCPYCGAQSLRRGLPCVAQDEHNTQLDQGTGYTCIPREWGNAMFCVGRRQFAEASYEQSLLGVIFSDLFQDKQFGHLFYPLWPVVIWTRKVTSQRHV